MAAVRHHSSVDKNLRYRHASRPSDDGPSQNRLVPAGLREPEMSGALTDGEPGVVCTLDGSPVIASGRLLVDWHPEPPAVVGDRRPRETESLLDLPIAEPGAAQLGDQTALVTGREITGVHGTHVRIRRGRNRRRFSANLRHRRLQLQVPTLEAIVNPNADWCNGNTLLSGSRIRGSNPWSAVSRIVEGQGRGSQPPRSPGSPRMQVSATP